MLCLRLESEYTKNVTNRQTVQVRVAAPISHQTRCHETAAGHCSLDRTQFLFLTNRFNAALCYRMVTPVYLARDGTRFGTKFCGVDLMFCCSTSDCNQTYLMRPHYLGFLLHKQGVKNLRP